MKRYDANRTPEPTEWLELDEQERILLIERFHRDRRIRIPSLKAHAAIHAVVENQLAMADQALVRETLDRLMKEGLDRHDALHAIGSVLLEHMSAIVRDPPGEPGLEESYHDRLRRLTAGTWRAS